MSISILFRDFQMLLDHRKHNCPYPVVSDPLFASELLRVREINMIGDKLFRLRSMRVVDKHFLGSNQQNVHLYFVACWSLMSDHVLPLGLIFPIAANDRMLVQKRKK